MKATDFLEHQHREVEKLFEQIESAEGKGREQRTLFNELAEKIENHAKIEEKIFYPEGREVDEDITLEAYEEHALVRTMVQKIKKTRTTDETFKARVSLLKELIEHHVEEEEEEYFPKCEKEFGSERLEELGLELEEAYLRLQPKARGGRKSHKQAMAA